MEYACDVHISEFKWKQAPNKKDYVRQLIYEEKWSVSPYFLHNYQDNNEAGML